MADTTALKNRIRAAIKANDNQEITGPVLQQSLLDIVDELNGATETEASQRQNGDSTLQQGINTERERAQNAEQQLGQRITREIGQARQDFNGEFDKLELADVTGSGVQSTELSIALNKNNGTPQDPEIQIIDTIVIPSATNQKAGLLNSQDKNQIDNIKFIPTSTAGVNNCVKELYIDGWQEGFYFNYFTWNGSVTSIVIKNSNGDDVLFANAKAATVGEVFKHSQNGVSLYAVFTSSTYDISPQVSNILESAHNISKNPTIEAYIIKNLKVETDATIIENSENPVQGGAVYNALYKTRFTDTRGVNNCIKELYIEGWQDGYYFNWFTWNGSKITIVVKDSNGNDVVFVNNVSATAGEVSKFERNSVKIYVVLTTSTYSIAPQRTNALDDAFNIGKSPNILLYKASEQNGGGEAFYTDNASLNACLEELYVTGLQEGYRFNYFTWDGSIATIVIRDSSDNVILFANARAATIGEVFKYSQNGVSLYAVFTSSTHSVSPQNSAILSDARSLNKNPKIEAYISLEPTNQKLDDEIKASRELCISRFDFGNVLPGADHNASWISISRRMDDTYDSVLSFANKTHSAVTNKFFDFYSVGRKPRGAKYITERTSYVDDTVGINGLSTSDAIMLAVIVGAVNNADGDNPTMAKWHTGGAHAYGDSASGSSATMREISNTVRVDGKLVNIGDIGIRGNICTIDVINNVQGYNTCKEDGTGREIVQQKFHVEITKDYCDVYTELVALEDIIVYGSNSITGMNVKEMTGFRFIGSQSKRGFYTFNNTGVVPSNGDNRINALRIENGDYIVDTECDLDYGLGNKLMSSSFNLIVTIAGKAYFSNIPENSQIELSEGDSISWKVRLKVRKK